jgi:hypothetical protein
MWLASDCDFSEHAVSDAVTASKVTINTTTPKQIGDGNLPSDIVTSFSVVSICGGCSW